MYFLSPYQKCQCSEENVTDQRPGLSLSLSSVHHRIPDGNCRDITHWCCFSSCSRI